MSVDIKRALLKATAGLTDEEVSSVNIIADLIHELSDIAEFHPKLPKLMERFEGLKYELEEISAEFADIADDTEYDGARLQEVNERLDQLFRLQKKHYVSSEAELFSLKAELEEIIKHTPVKRQTMLFSATMTDNIDELIKLSLNHFEKCPIFVF